MRLGCVSRPPRPAGLTQPGVAPRRWGGVVMRARTRWTAGLSAVAILLTAAVSAFGYTGQVPATATVSVAGTVACNNSFTVIKHVPRLGRRASRQPVRRMGVRGPSSPARIRSTIRSRSPTRTASLRRRSRWLPCPEIARSASRRATSAPRLSFRSRVARRLPRRRRCPQRHPAEVVPAWFCCSPRSRLLRARR